MNEGAKKIGVVGIPPIGCLPAIITINSQNPISDRKCIDRLNALSRSVNQMIQNNLKGIERPDTRLVYADIYTPIIDMVENKAKYGKSIILPLIKIYVNCQQKYIDLVIVNAIFFDFLLF